MNLIKKIETQTQTQTSSFHSLCEDVTFRTEFD